MTEKTFIIIKPDGVKRGKIGEIIKRVEAKGYLITAINLRIADRSILEEHYAEHVDKPFFDGLVEYMTSGPLVTIVAEGENVVEGWRNLMGDTKPTSAAPGTIRGDLARDWQTSAIQNLVHGSDSIESAEREINIWFR